MAGVSDTKSVASSVPELILQKHTGKPKTYFTYRRRTKSIGNTEIGNPSFQRKDTIEIP